MAPKVVLISGCSSGMGLTTAVFLAQDSEKRFKVYATMRNLAKKGQLEEEGKEYLGDTLIIKQMDVCSDESVEKAVKEVLDTEGRIDVLFNNAGLVLFSAVECTPVSEVQKMFDVNFFGSLRLIKAVLPSMKSRHSGHIIINSSAIGFLGLPFMDVCSASKFAIEGLCESLAPILLQFNIRCTIVEPGPVETPLFQTGADWGKTLDHSTADEKTQKLMKMGIAGMEEMKTKSLKANEIAAIVKEIILGQNTNFRCYTNVDFLPDELAAKMKDPFTNEFIDLLGKRFFEQQGEEK
ncbi:retinol dehydrogenase 8-like [Oculina patagonica]